MLVNYDLMQHADMLRIHVQNSTPSVRAIRLKMRIRRRVKYTAKRNDIQSGVVQDSMTVPQCGSTTSLSIRYEAQARRLSAYKHRDFVQNVQHELWPRFARHLQRERGTTV